MKIEADSCNSEAQCLIADCYSEGKGTPKSDKNAIHYFKLAKEGAHTPFLNSRAAMRKALGLKSLLKKHLTIVDY